MEYHHWTEGLLNFLKPVGRVSLPVPYMASHPFESLTIYENIARFSEVYYNDDSPRTLCLGINPGRMGGGRTGLPFTSPNELKTLGISMESDHSKELSSTFIYEAIRLFGGPKAFYDRFVIHSVFPYCITRHGRNANYYDIPDWRKYLEGYITDHISRLLTWPVNRERVVCLGMGNNLDALEKLNRDHNWFGQIVALPHPRWIMQYRRRQIHEHLKDYVSTFSALSNNHEATENFPVLLSGKSI